MVVDSTGGLVTRLGEILTSGMAPLLIGYIPVFRNEAITFDGVRPLRYALHASSAML
jgi:hypothetical protein